jgi:lipoprotein-anchoring transpeptidase ErfK/SrfK
MICSVTAHGAKDPKRKKKAAARTQAAALTLDANAVNSPTQPEIKFGDKGAAVLRAQILLARAHFSCGEIDALFGRNLQKAATVFQYERNLPATGMVDAATWAALNADTAPALTSYRISEEKVKGPFVRIPPRIADQASLPALGYASALEGLAEGVHSSPQVLKALNPQAAFQSEQDITVPNTVTMPPAGPAAKIVVSKSEGSVRAVDASGNLLAFYVATIGSEHDPLPVGDWKILGVGRNPVFHYNPSLFWDAKATDEKAVIQPGPNNPVGPVWIDLSKEHYGIHGTPEPSRIGHTESHGCIRLTNWDALELAGLVKPNTPAELRD